MEIERKEGPVWWQRNLQRNLHITQSTLQVLPDLQFGKKDVTNFIISERPD